MQIKGRIKSERRLFIIGHRSLSPELPGPSLPLHSIPSGARIAIDRDRERRTKPAMEEIFLSIASMRSTAALRFSSAASPVEVTPSWVPSPPSTPAQDETSPVDEEMKDALDQVQCIIGYSFNDLSLLEEALTHSSYPFRASYQRLEFVGDAVLNLAFTNFVYLTNPSVGPGSLSVLRAANISTEKLARVAIRHDFYRYLRRHSPILDSMVSIYRSISF